MTNEQRYATICELIREHDICFPDGRDMVKRICENPEEWAKSGGDGFYVTAAKLLLDAAGAMDKEKTGAGRISALKRLYKDAKGMNKREWAGYMQNGERFVLMSSCRFVRMVDRINSIPMAELGGAEPFAPDRIIPQDYADREIVQLPTVAEIKKYMAANGLTAATAGDRPMEALPDWWCNPQFLLDMQTIIPGGIAYKPNNHYDVLYYRTETEDALLCPMRHNAA